MKKDIKYWKVIPFVVVIFVVFSFSDYLVNYHGISLDNVACRIPKRMWDGSDKVKYISDHMFFLENIDETYIVYGSQLEKYDNDDEAYGLLHNFDMDQFLNYSNADQLCMAIQESSDILENVVDIWKTERPSYSQYCIKGEPGGDYSDYLTYIVALKKSNMSFVEIILYKKPESLLNVEQRNLYKHINYLFDN